MRPVIEPMKTLNVGDPVTLNDKGLMVKWIKGCGRPLLGILPEGSKMIDGYMVIPSWFSKMLYGDNCQ